LLSSRIEQITYIFIDYKVEVLMGNKIKIIKFYFTHQEFLHFIADPADVVREYYYHQYSIVYMYAKLQQIHAYGDEFILKSH